MSRPVDFIAAPVRCSLDLIIAVSFSWDYIFSFTLSKISGRADKECSYLSTLIWGWMSTYPSSIFTSIRAWVNNFQLSLFEVNIKCRNNSVRGSGYNSTLGVILCR